MSEEASKPFRGRDIRVIVINLILWRLLHEEHTKSELRDEEYILRSQKFQQAVAEARKRLGFTDKLLEGTKIANEKEALEKGENAYEGDLVIGLLHFIEHRGEEMSVEDFGAHEDRFNAELLRALEEAGLSRAWASYMEHFILFDTPPEDKLIHIPKAIEAVSYTPDEELIIRLRPGLRYEDYRKAWGAFKKHLGHGKRLQKSFGDNEVALQMLKDHNDGMTYKAITLKYYPDVDPDVNYDRVKKAIQRAKQRFERDK